MIATVTDPPFATGLRPWAQCLPDHISPTAAKAYHSCSLMFYFERVACIKRKAPVALHLGKAVHAAPGLSVPLTGAMDLVEGNFTPVDFKSSASKPDKANAAFDHEIQLVSYQFLMEAAIGETPPSLDLVFLVKTKKPQTIRVTSPPADARRRQRVVALLETAVDGIASKRYHLQPGMQCSWCQFKNECMAWLPSMTVREVQRAA